jgi:fibronectin-binding autotransporter adhesin
MSTIHRFATAFVLLSLLAMPAAFAGQVVWNGSTDANWSTAANWTPAATPTAGDDVVLTGAGTNPTNQDIGGLSINSLTFDGTATSAFTVSGSGISLSSSGTTISVDPAAADHTLAVDLTLNNASSWSIGAGRILTVTGAVSRFRAPAEILNYNFDESAGTNAADSSGNSLDATLQNGASFVASHENNGVSFDGNDDYVLAPSFQFSSPMTIAVWVYSSNPFANWNRIIDFGSGTPNDNLLLAFPGNSGQMTLQNFIGGGFQGSITTTDVFPTNTWVHVTATIAPGSATIYWNGVVKATGSIGTVPNVTRTNQYIGRSNWGGDAFFKGQMDDFRIYNRVLSVAEITQLATVIQLTKSGAGRLVLGGTTTTPLTISAGVVEATSSTLPATVVNNAALEINQIADGTYSGSISGTGTLNKIGGAVLTLDGVNTFSGATTLGAGALNAVGPEAGLKEGRLNTNFDTTSPNPATSTQLTPRYANIIDNGNAYPNTGGAWIDNSTFVYSGYINNSTGANVVYTFAENFDDLTLLKIDGNTVLNDGAWNNPTLGNYTLTPGLHSFELRLGEGGGGVGPSNQGWLNNSIGFGIDMQGRGQAIASNFAIPTDNGSGALFVTANSQPLSPFSDLILSAGTTLDVQGAVMAGSIAGSGSITLTSGGLTAGSSNASTTFDGVISGAGSFNKAGSGTLTLTANNTYAGATGISSGTLRVGNGGATGSIGAGNTTNNGTLIFDRSNATSYDGVISGSGTLVKNGAGVLTLSAASTYAGGTTINAGTIRLSLPTGALAGSSLWLDGADTATLFKDVGGTIPVAVSGDTVALWKDKSGNARDASQNNGAQQPLYTRLSKNGASAVRFDGADDQLGVDLSFLVGNQYTFFVVEGKRGTKGSNYFLGTGTAAQNEGLHVGYRGDNDYTLAQYANDLDYNNNSLVYTGTQVFRTWTNMLDATGHRFLLNGTQVASNGDTTPFITANAGTVGRGFQGGTEYVGDLAEIIFFNSALSLNSRLAVEAYLNAKWNGVLPAGGVVSIASGATLDLNGVSQTIAGLADVSGAAGLVTNGTATTQATITVDSATGTPVFSGSIQDGAGTITFAKSGAFTQILAGANAPGGGTYVQAGTLQIGNGGTTGSIAGNIVDNATLTFNRSDATVFPNSISGTGSVVQNGAGLLTFNNSNTYSGTTTLNGPVDLTAAGGLNGTSSITLNNTTLQILDTADNSSHINDSASINFNFGTLNVIAPALPARAETVGALVFNSGSNTISITPTATADAQLLSASFTRNGGATLNFLRGTAAPETANLFTGGIADNTFIGYATVNGGPAVYTLANGLVNTTPMFTIAPGNWNDGSKWNTSVAPTINDDVIVRHAMTMTSSDSVRSLSFDNGAPDISGAGFTLTVDSGLIIVSGAVSPNVSVGLSTSASVWNIAQGSTGTLTLSGSVGPISGVSLTKSGSGRLALSGANVYDGTTTINAGVLAISNDTALGSTAAGTVIANGAALEVSGNINVGAENLTISGTGIANAGALRNVSGINSIGGSLTLPAATLVTIVGGAPDSLAVNGGLLGTGALTKNGPGTLALGGSSANTTTITVSAGTLQGTTDSLKADIVDNALLIFNQTTAGAFSKIVSGSGSIVKNGTGSVTLTNTNTYGGTTAVNAGTLGVGTPLPPAGNVLWLDAYNPSTFTLNGLNQVSEWRDAAGGPDKVVQTLGTPTLVSSSINGHPAVRFRAANPDILRTLTNFPAPCSVFYIGKLNGGTNQRLVTASNNWLLGFWGGKRDQAHFDGWVSNGGNGPAADTLPYIYGVTFGGGGQNTTFTSNGTVIASNQGGVNGPNGLALGGWWTYGEYSDGDVGEVLVYNTNLNTAARQSVETYLNNKWFGTNFGINAIPDSSAVTVAAGATLDVRSATETIGSLAGAGFVTLGTGTLTTGGDNSTTTFSGIISGIGGNITKQGTGTFVLSGANTYDGTTTVSTGVLRALNNTALGTAAGGTTVASGAALEVDGGIALGNEGLTLSGTGIANGGALRSISGSNSFGTRLNTLLADTTIGVNAGTLTLSGSITGSFSITKVGAGDLVLAATSSYTGSTTISAGTIRLATPTAPQDAAAYYSFDNVVGTTVNNDGSALNKNGTLINGATIVPGGVVGNAMSIGQFGTDFMAINLTNIGGQNKGIDLSGGNWTASCWFNGLWPTSQWRTLYRGNVNDHQVIIENGSKRLGVYDGNTGGGFRPSGYDVGVGGVETGWHKLVVVGSGSTTSFYIDDVFVGISDRNSPTDIYAVGNIQFGGQAFSQLLDEVYIFQRAWTSDELNRFVLPGTTQVRIAAGATLDVNGIAQTVGSIADIGGAGVRNILLGAGTLTTGKDNSNTSYTGAISGAGNLTKIGTGTFDVGGNSTYAGATTINGGILRASSTTAVPATSAVVFANVAGAELNLNIGAATLQVGSLAGGGTLGGNVTLGNGTLSIGNDNTSTTYGGVISGAGNIVKVGNGTQTWTGANVYAGTTDINNGTLKVTGTVAGLFEGRVNGGFDLGQPNPSTSVQLTTRYANIIDNSFGNTYPATGGAWLDNTTYIYSGFINNPTAGNVTYTFAENFDDSVRLMIDGSQVLFDGAYNNPTFANYTLTPGYHTFELRLGEGGGGVGPTNIGWLNNGIGFGIDFQGRNQNVASNYVIPADTGDGSLFVSSIAPQSIPSTTAVTVAALGTLDLGNANVTIGSLAGAGSTVLGYGHLATGGNNSTTAFSGVISGTSGSLDKQGTGKMTLTGANTYTGPTTVTAGTLGAASNTALGTAAGGTTVQNGATLEVNGGITIGAEALTLGGTGVANGGALRSLSGDNVIGAAPITLTADTTINVAANSLTLYGGISGAFGIDKTGAGLLALGGFSTYTGTTTISGGTIQLLAAGSPQDFAAYYSFDNVAGTTVFNEGTLANKDGTLMNGAAITTGIVGNAMAITQQTPQYMAIQLSNNKGLDLSGGNWSISTWFNGIFSPNDWRTLTRGNTGDHQIIIENGSNRLGGYDNAALGFQYSGYDVATAGVTTGWHQLTAVAAGGQTLVYIDGVQVGTIPLQSSTDIFAFGNLQGSGQTFSAKLDEFYFYKRALTPAEVQRMVIPYILPMQTQVRIATGATLDLNGTDQIVGSVVDSAVGATGNIVLGSAKLTTGKDNLATTYSGTISGTGSVTKVGTGTFTVSGTSTYSGTTTINGGILSATTTTAVPATSAVTLANVAGAVLDLNVGATTFTIGSLAGGGPLGGNVTLGAATLSIGGDNSSTNFSGVISGTGGIVKIGNGTQSLTGNNTYAGTTLVNVGTLKAGYSPPAGSVLWLDATDASTMTLNGSQVSEWRDKTGLAEKVVQGNPGQQPTLTPGGINGLPVVHVTSANNRTMTTNTNFGTPSTVLYVSRQTGGVNQRLLAGVFNNWLLGYWGNNRRVAYFNGWVNPPGPTSATPDTNPYIYSATIPGTGQNSSFYENGVLVAANQGGTEGPNGLALNGNGEVSDGDIAEILVYNSALSNAARSQAEAYLKAKWLVGLPNVIPDNSDVTVAPGATLDISGSAETIGSLAGDGFVLLTGGALTTGGTNATTAYAGVISGTGGTLTKQGAGTMTLSGANTYTGVTTVAAGILAATNSASLGTSAGGTTVQNGAELDISNNITLSDAVAITGSGVGNGGALHSISGDNTITSSIILTGDAQINVDAQSLYVDGATTGGANFTKDGAGLLILNGGNSYTGATIINDGTLRISNTTTAFAGNALWLDSADATTLFKDTAGTLPAAVGDQVGLWKDKSGNTRNAQQANPGNQPLRVSNTQSGLTAMRFSGAQLMNLDLSFLTGSQYTIIAVEGKTAAKGGNNYYMGTAPGATNQAMHLGYRNDTDYTFAQYANDLDYANASLAYTGTQVFRTWTDTLSATGHTIYLNSAQVASNGNTNPFVAANNGTVGVGFGGGTEYIGDLAEIVVFNSALSASQRTSIESYLSAKWSGSLLPKTTQVQIAGGATLDLNGYSQTIGSVVDIGLSGGDVALGGATLTTGNDNLNTSFSGDITGSGNLVKIGTGIFDVSGASTYTGATTINAGVLSASSTTALPSTTDVTIANVAGATLDLNGVDLTIGSLSGGGPTGGSVTLGGILTSGGNNLSTSFGGVLSGAGGIVKTGSGTLTLSGANTYAGVTDVSAGVLKTSGLPFPGMGVWLDAADAASITKDVTNHISQWNDRSGNARHFSQTTGSAQPVYTAGALNGLPVVRMDGVDDRLTLNSATNPRTVFFVNVPAPFAFIPGTNFLNGIYGNSNPGDKGIRMDSSTTWADPGDGNDYTNGGGTLFINGVAGRTFTSSVAHVLTAQRGGSFGGAYNNTHLGWYYDTARVYNGDIAEVLVYESVLNNAQQQAVEAYLMSKWGLGVATYNVLPDGSAVSVAAGATLDVSNINETIGSLTGAGSVLLGGASLTTGGDNSTTSFSGAISGTGGGLVKQGNGAMTLSGTNTYTGATSLNGGILLVDGSIGAGALTSAAGTTLGGIGTIGGNVTAGGDVAPGNGGIGTLNILGNVDFSSGASLTVEIDGTLPSADQLNVSGTVNINANVALNASIGAPTAHLDALTVLNNGSASPITGTFNGVPNRSPITVGTNTFVVRYDQGVGSNDIVFTDDDVPTAIAQTVSPLEDVLYTITLTGSDPNGQALTFAVASGPTNGTLGTITQVTPTSATVTYTGNLNFNGADSFTFTVDDGLVTSPAATVTVNVQAVNDVPSFTKGTDPTVLEDAAPVSIANWATGISAGPADESGQTLTFNVVGNTNPGLFSVAPAVASNGTLTFTVAPDANGSADITLNLQDNGGTANGGVDTSATQTFTINVTAVNDVPSFTVGVDQTVLEDAGAQTVANWITVMSPGPADEAGQLLGFSITANSNPTLFSVLPAVSSTGTLTYTPAADANGSATVTIRIQDNGGTANGGVDTSATQTFVINVTPVNDTPVATAQTVAPLEDVATVINLAGVDSDPEVVQTLTFAIVTGPSNGTLSGFNAATGQVTYTSNLNYNGPDSFTFTVTDDASAGATANLTSAAATVTLNVTAVNDAPSFTVGLDQTVLEDAGPQTVPNWATGLSTGPVDEAGQTLAFVITANTNAAMFSAGPAVASDGTLTYTPAANANGSATITLRITDNGGTANGGVNQSATQSFTINVTPVNDQPIATPQSVVTGEDIPVVITLTGDDADTQVVQTLTFAIVTPPVHGTLSGFNPATGQVTYTPNSKYNGNDSFTFTVTDDGLAGATANLTSTPGTVSISVTNTNNQPTAGDQNLNDGFQRPLAITLFGDDGDPEVQVLTFTIVQQPAHGLLSNFNSATGTVTYTPANGFVGVDTFTYTVRDDATAGPVVNLVSAPGTITINVTAPPSFGSQPVVSPDSAIVGQPLTFMADAGNATLVWDFGDGVTATGGSVTHTYTTPGVFNASVTATSPEGVSTTYTVAIFVGLDTDDGSSSAGAGVPGVTGILIGGKGQQKLQGGAGKLSVNFLQRGRTSFSGSVGQIKFPTGVTYASMVGTNGILTIGKGALKQDFLFTLDKRGRGRTTFLSKAQVDLKKKRFIFKAGNRPELTDVMESIGANFVRDMKKGPIKTIYIPATLQLGSQVTLVITFQMTYQQRGNTGKGTLAKP